MSEHDKLIEQLKSVLTNLESTPVQAEISNVTSMTIRHLAKSILDEAEAKYPGTQLTDF